MLFVLATDLMSLDGITSYKDCFVALSSRKRTDAVRVIGVPILALAQKLHQFC